MSHVRTHTHTHTHTHTLHALGHWQSFCRHLNSTYLYVFWYEWWTLWAYYYTYIIIWVRPNCTLCTHIYSYTCCGASIQRNISSYHLKHSQPSMYFPLPLTPLFPSLLSPSLPLPTQPTCSTSQPCLLLVCGCTTLSLPPFAWLTEENLHHLLFCVPASVCSWQLL